MEEIEDVLSERIEFLRFHLVKILDFWKPLRNRYLIH